MDWSKIIVQRRDCLLQNRERWRRWNSRIGRLGTEVETWLLSKPKERKLRTSSFSSLWDKRKGRGHTQISGFNKPGRQYIISNHFINDECDMHALHATNRRHAPDLHPAPLAEVLLKSLEEYSLNETWLHLNVHDCDCYRYSPSRHKNKSAMFKFLV